MNDRNSSKPRKKKKKSILSNRLLRLVLSLLYLLAAWIVLSRFGFLPAFLSLNLKQKAIDGELGDRKKYVQSDVKVNSPFYYTGDSFAKLMIDRDEPTIDPGAIWDLDILSNANSSGMGYYNVDKDVYYFLDAPKVLSFTPGQKGLVSTARKKVTWGLDYSAREEFTYKATSDSLTYTYVLQYRDLYIVPVRGQGVVVYADGTHSSGGMSFDQFSRDKVAEVGDILLLIILAAVGLTIASGATVMVVGSSGAVLFSGAFGLTTFFAQIASIVMSFVLAVTAVSIIWDTILSFF